MNQKFRISVVLPFHRNDRYLSEALNSCYNSKGCKIEVVLVDTRNKIESERDPIHDLPNFTKTISAPNLSYTRALALGIKHSTFEYIAIMNSDDLINNQRFEKQIKRIMETKSDVCLCNIIKFTSRNNRKIPAAFGHYSDSHYQILSLLLGSYGADATWLFKKRWAQRNNLFVEKTDISDWTTALRVLKKSKVCKVAEDLYFYRIHNLQTSRQQLTHARILEKELMSLNRHLNLPKIKVAAIRYISGIERPKIRDFFSSQYTPYPTNWFDSFERKLNPFTQDLNEIILRRKLFFCLSNYRNLRFLNILTVFRVIRDLLNLRGYNRW